MSNKPEGSYLLTWQDDVQPILGEGLSRTSNHNAQLWRVDVETSGALPMKTTVRATSRRQAIQFTKNRYPTATNITVLGKANVTTN